MAHTSPPWRWPELIKSHLWTARPPHTQLTRFTSPARPLGFCCTTRTTTPVERGLRRHLFCQACPLRALPRSASRLRMLRPGLIGVRTRLLRDRRLPTGLVLFRVHRVLRLLLCPVGRRRLLLQHLRHFWCICNGSGEIRISSVQIDSSTLMIEGCWEQKIIKVMADSLCIMFLDPSISGVIYHINVMLVLSHLDHNLTPSTLRSDTLICSHNILHFIHRINSDTHTTFLHQPRHINSSRASRRRTKRDITTRHTPQPRRQEAIKHHIPRRHENTL